MVKRSLAAIAALLLVLSVSGGAGGETRREYENRLRVMIDLSVRLDEYVRQHLGDRSLAAYAEAIALQTVAAAERMTPPKDLAHLHPHLVLVLENIERSFHHAAEGRLDRYRHHQKIVRKELQLFESMAEQAGLGLFDWRR
jgi:hypothetical protein